MKMQVLLCYFTKQELEKSGAVGVSHISTSDDVLINLALYLDIHSVIYLLMIYVYCTVN